MRDGTEEHDGRSATAATTEQEAASQRGTGPDAAAVVLELEHAGWQALSTGDAKGAEHYAALMTEHAVMALANGQVMERDEVIAALRDSPPWDTYTIDAPRVLALTDDVRAVVYEATGTRGDTAFHGVMSSVYVRTDAGWRLALHHQTAR